MESEWSDDISPMIDMQGYQAQLIRRKDKEAERNVRDFCRPFWPATGWL